MAKLILTFGSSNIQLLNEAVEPKEAALEDNYLKRIYMHILRLTEAHNDSSLSKCCPSFSLEAISVIGQTRID